MDAIQVKTHVVKHAPKEEIIWIQHVRMVIQFLGALQSKKKIATVLTRLKDAVIHVVNTVQILKDANMVIEITTAKMIIVKPQEKVNVA